MVECEDCGATGGKWYQISKYPKVPQLIALCQKHVNEYRANGYDIYPATNPKYAD